MRKLKVCVLFGGVSTEHNISEVSVSAVLDSINKDKYEVYPVGITEEGKWLFYEGETELIREHKWKDGSTVPALLSPDRSEKELIVFDRDGIRRIKIDVVYPVLHGKNGEDGTVQGLCELAGIPCVGSGVVGSAVCMDKCIAKILFDRANIPQSDWTEVRRGETPDYKKIEERLGFPCFIKPSSAGSSIGVTKASNRDELKAGIELALKHDCKVLVEEAIDAREVECGIIGNECLRVSDVLGEIKPAEEFYDYKAKYESAQSELVIPAQISEETEEKIKEYAAQAYRICECRGYSRVDFFIDRRDGRIILNEINTIPGFTSISMYPKVWEKSGISMTELIDKHIELALSRRD